MHCCENSSASSSVMFVPKNMSTNSTIDHCRVPSQATYETLSWLMIGEFVLGLPLNLSVLYVFIFRNPPVRRYWPTISHRNKYY